MKLMVIFLWVVSSQAVPFRKLIPIHGGGRIVGGQDASPGQFPYHVSVVDNSFGLDFHFCGASIYDASTMITAAHCVFDEDYENPVDLEVVAGDLSLSDTDSDEQRRSITRIIIHEDYQSFSSDNDIALLKLDSILDLSSPSVSSIALPEAGETFTGSCTVTGWSSDSSGGSSSDVLQYVEVPLISIESCSGSYGTIGDCMICAGGEGNDACQGDSGSALVCQDKLAGVVSWGQGCGVAGYPMVYTEVACFVDWIITNSQ